jgi:hypothetical protein
LSCLILTTFPIFLGFIASFVALAGKMARSYLGYKLGELIDQ